jgi:hypothetical protein
MGNGQLGFLRANDLVQIQGPAVPRSHMRDARQVRAMIAQSS